MKRLQLFSYALYRAYTHYCGEDSHIAKVKVQNFFLKSENEQRAIFKDLKSYFSPVLLTYARIMNNSMLNLSSIKPTDEDFFFQEIKTDKNKDVFLLSVFTELFFILDINSTEVNSRIKYFLNMYNTINESQPIDKANISTVLDFLLFITKNISNADICTDFLAKLLLDLLSRNANSLKNPQLSFCWTPLLIQELEQLNEIGKDFCVVKKLPVITTQSLMSFVAFLETRYWPKSESVKDLLKDVFEVNTFSI